MRLLKRYYNELSFSRLKVTRSTSLKPCPTDFSKIPFGSYFTDHMLEVDWTESGGWTDPEIKPHQPLTLDPASSVFHYCTECYEGFKVYRNGSKILTFRPEMNMQRFTFSSDAAGLPMADPKELLKCIEALIKVDRDWVPNNKGYSLYVRPNMFGTHAQLSVACPKLVKLVVIMSPVGPYFRSGLKPIKLYCDESIVRAWPGGVGHRKLGGNYAPGVVHAEMAKSKGYDQILWLSEKKVTEVGVMNFFVVLNHGTHLELITSPIDNTTLPGITRDSVLTLHREEGKIKVTEREYTIDDLIQWIQEGKVEEAFGTGTAAVICPISLLGYKGKNYEIPTKFGESGQLSHYTRELLLSIKHGDNPHKWNYYID